MSIVYRANRKASDYDIIRLNSVGLSLATIARLLGCHPTTVTLRLRSLGVPAADTRRTFMEDVFCKLTSEEQEWLANSMEGGCSLKELVRRLLAQAHQEHLKGTNDVTAI
jgi:hypothetical protein